jgi:ubiquinone/menaquinone biosynthesis C-methylase UbiE
MSYKINNKEYNMFIEKSDDLTDCQKKIFVEYRSMVNMFYVKQDSNHQIQTLISNISKNEAFYYESKVKMIFYKFFSRIMGNELYDFIKNNPHLKDFEIMSFIKERSKYDRRSNNDNRSLSIKICNEWEFIIDIIVLHYKKMLKNMGKNLNYSNLKYIDIGCGRGNKTYKISKKLELNNKNIYGADIEKWGPYEQSNLNHKFNFIKIKNGKINGETNYFDFATCILMLHHVENLDDFLKEVKRVLKPGGILIVIEHNIYDDYDHLILDMLHFLYGYLVDKNHKYIDNPDFAHYFNWIEWQFILEKNGFTQLDNKVLFTKINDETRYDNIFYSMFINNKN